MPRAGSPRRTVRSVMTPRLCSTNTTPGAITTPPAKRNPCHTRWLGLIQIARNPYRLYMRGRGPKWYAKHQGHTERGPALRARPLGACMSLRRATREYLL